MVVPVKRALVLGVVTGVVWLLFWPRVVMLRCLEGDARALGALQGLREKVAAYRYSHDRYPASLAEVGVPALELYSYDAGADRVHAHRLIDQEAPLVGAADGDEGKWLYDPQTGRVVLGCTAVETKLRRPWNQH
ncbi:hypothetical protein EPO15_15580 [bacterium]|nr:MAG: hypothetical protein EPO15_15580 [bacterium]